MSLGFKKGGREDFNHTLDSIHMKTRRHHATEGKSKEKNGGGVFRAVHTPWNKGPSIIMEEAITSYHRQTQDQESLYVNKDRKGNIMQNDDEIVNEAGRTMVLRAGKLPGSRIARFLGKKAKKEDSHDVNGYRIWHAKLAVHACASAQTTRQTQTRMQRPGQTISTGREEEGTGYFGDAGVRHL
ncbi:FCH domain only [Branchiostoma belcheri]|nr:FCH domain only [Branchiostoma belcheri]